MKNSFKNLISLFTFILAISLFSCRNEDIQTNNIDDQQRATEFVKKAANEGLLIEIIKPYGDDFEFYFNDGTTTLIKPTAEGSNGNVFVRSVQIGAEQVTFIFTDNSNVSIAKKYALSIEFETEDLGAMEFGETRFIRYEIKSSLDDVKLDIKSYGSAGGALYPDSDNPLTGRVLITSSSSMKGGFVVVYVTNGHETVQKRITQEEAGLLVDDNSIKMVDSKGGDVQLEFLSNVSYKLYIPDEYKDWISETPQSRSLEHYTLNVTISPNLGVDRMAKIELRSEYENFNLAYIIHQKGEQGYVIDSSIVPPDEIWYITESGKPVDIYARNSIAFFENVKSHEYIDGKGVIKFYQPVKTMNGEVFYETDVTQVFLPEGFEAFQGGHPFGWSKLKSFTVPNSIKYIYGLPFRGCREIEGFYGNDQYHTKDNLCFINKPTSKEGTPMLITSFCGYDLESYTIEEGIEGIENYAFENMTNLKKITFPSTLVHIMEDAFIGSENIEEIYGPQTSSDHRFFMKDGKLCKLIAKKNFPTHYNIPDEVTSLDYGIMMNLHELEEVYMGDQMVSISPDAFIGCDKLQKVTLSAGLRYVGDLYSSMTYPYHPFQGCTSLKEIYLRALIPPHIDCMNYWNETFNFKIYVPQQSLEAYKNSGWSIYGDCLVGYDYGELPQLYTSTDYSKDGEVKVLQKATQGNGINIVMMCDGYSDRQIAQGLYDDDINYLYSNLFSEEPYKSFKDCFNVYSVTTVSSMEGAAEGLMTALETSIGQGTYVEGNHEKVMDYALNAISEEDLDEAVIVVALNANTESGTTFMWYPDEKTANEYGSGLAVSYFAKSGGDGRFAEVLLHEVNGHAFGKLGDEYSYEGTISNEEIERCKTMDSYGWYKNIDFTSNPKNVKWHKFIEDSRYSSQGIGVFEGGYTFAYGVWRPTQTSIMVYNQDGFNAPSREAIYQRIHRLAYGKNWTYSYEDFVNYDLSSISHSTRSNKIYGSSEKIDLHSPVVIKENWREYKKK